MTTALVRPEASAAITVDKPVPQAVVVYSTSFELTVDSWTPGTETARSRDTNMPHSGSYSLRVQRSTVTAGLALVQRIVTGLTIGRRYILSAYVGCDSSSVINAAVGVAGIGTGTAVTPSLETAVIARAVFAFTATATSHTITMQTSHLGLGLGIAWWDDVQLVEALVTLPISEGKMTLADDWAPYAQARFDVPLTDPALSEQVDPKTGQRVIVTASDGVGGTSRTFDLGLRARSIDHRAKTITMELASDEALLMDRKNVSAAVDSTPRTYETSLRAICNWALGKIGASLEAGTDDADLTAYFDARNLITDPGTADTQAGVWGVSNGQWDHNDASWSISGDGDSFNLYGPTNAECSLRLGTESTSLFQYGMQPGKTYVFSATGNVKQVIGGQGPAEPDAGTGTSMRRALALVIHTHDGSAWKLWHSPQVTNTVGAATRVAVAFTIPKNATCCFIRAYHGGTSGEIRWDGFRLSERGPGTVDDDAVYFDGDTADTARYVYDWEGAQDASPSTRRATTQRMPALFNWRPGQSLWEFLQPLFEASGLRLFCDEQRKWRLVNPATYVVPGYVTAQEKHNATRGTDEITRNDDTWADAVVAVYEWDDAEGNAQTAYDFAGSTTGKCVTLTYDREFPGPGAAAYALARLQGKGRTQEVTALTIYTATPGQDATIALPGTLVQTGKVREVVFDLKTGLMDLGTRGLTDAYPGSWSLRNPTEVWSAAPATQKWKDA